MATIEQITLYFREGTSDKQYELELQRESAVYRVRFGYGRRGTQLQRGTKYEGVSAPSAGMVFEKFLREKLAKGYKVESIGQRGRLIGRALPLRPPAALPAAPPPARPPFAVVPPGISPGVFAAARDVVRTTTPTTPRQERRPAPPRREPRVLFQPAPEAPPPPAPKPAAPKVDPFAPAKRKIRLDK